MPKQILLTGAAGFIGRNLTCELSRLSDQYIPLCADIDTPPEQLAEFLSRCDAVVHLAGVNRPQTEQEFFSGNTDFTRRLTEQLQARGPLIPILMTSSIQAALDNPYGKSKLGAEEALLEYQNQTGAPVFIFRLPNVFGKWCRPNYNSAVATFCHNIARNLPVSVSDRANRLTLVYIDDVLRLILDALDGKIQPQNDGYCAVPVTHSATLGEIVDLLYAFRDSRTSLAMPSQSDGFCKKLYSTYLSYLPEEAFAYPLTAHTDVRGAFYEFFKTDGYGQFSVSTTAPGITRGNHWHHTKNEKFLVVAGRASVRLRKIDRDLVVTYDVGAEQPQVVDIPPGYTHSITNISPDETLVTLIWANEPFDAENPDTYYLEP